jgi:hypothetical protein
MSIRDEETTVLEFDDGVRELSSEEEVEEVREEIENVRQSKAENAEGDT